MYACVHPVEGLTRSSSVEDREMMMEVAAWAARPKVPTVVTSFGGDR